MTKCEGTEDQSPLSQYGPITDQNTTDLSKRTHNDFVLLKSGWVIFGHDVFSIVTVQMSILNFYPKHWRKSFKIQSSNCVRVSLEKKNRIFSFRQLTHIILLKKYTLNSSQKESVTLPIVSFFTRKTWCIVQ